MTEVYRNLRRAGGCWSVREGGRVVAHVQAITLADVVLVVRPGGRARVLRTGHREVHAYARGTIVQAPRPAGAIRIHYRPFLAGAFHDDDGHEWIEAAILHLDEEGRAWLCASGIPASGST